MDKEKHLNISFSDLPIFASDTQKRANDFRRAKEYMEFYYHSGGIANRKEWVDKIEMNSDLYNGRWKDVEKQTSPLSWDLQGEKIEFKSGVPLRHYPVVDRVAKHVVSHVMMTDLRPHVIDYSPDSHMERKRVKKKLVQQMFQSKVDAIRSKITHTYLIENGLDDLYALAEEEQQQVQADIENRVALEAGDIMDYLNKEYKPRIEYGLQLLLNHYNRSERVKEKEVQGFENSLLSGLEVYRVYEKANVPVFEALNSKFFDWGSSNLVENIEDADFAKYEIPITHTELMNRHGHHLRPSDLKKLIDGFGPINSDGYGTPEDPKIKKRFVEEMQTNPRLREADYRTQEGQEVLWNTYAGVASLTRQGWGIPECHIAWKWSRDMYLVYRQDPKTGNLKSHWRTADYEPSRLKGDIKWTKCRVPQVWEGTRLGFTDCVYVGVRQLPHQHLSLDNPFDVKLPYVGGEYNRLMGNSKNVAFIDLGKPFQYRYNVQMQRIEEMESTHIGKVLLATANMKPDDWTWDEWWASLRIGKAAIIATQGEGPNAMDAQFFKSMDLGNLADISSSLDMLREWEDKIYNNMYFNRSKLGEGSPYKGVRTNEMDSAAADKQLMSIYNKHNDIMERAMNQFLRVIIHCAAQNPNIKYALLDDYSAEEIDIDFSKVDPKSIGLLVENSYNNTLKLQEFKQFIPMLINAGNLTLTDLAKVAFSETIAEILKTSDTIEAKVDKIREATEAAQAEREKKELDTTVLLKEMDARLTAHLQEQKDAATMDRTLADREKFALQHDINKDGVHDSYERAMLEIAAKDKIEAEKRKVEREKIAAQERTEKEKLKAMKTISRQKK